MSLQRKQQISVIRNETFPSSDEEGPSLDAYLCAESIDNSKSRIFYNQLLQQAHEAKMKEIQDKNLESITIEKEQKIISGGHGMKIFSKKLDDISFDQEQYQQKLSEEMYGQHRQTRMSELISEFCELLGRLQQLCDQILTKRLNDNVKRVPTTVPNGSSRNSSPKLRDFPEEIMKILQKENVSLQLNNEFKQINSDFRKIIKRYSPMRKSPSPPRSDKPLLKPIKKDSGKLIKIVNHEPSKIILLKRPKPNLNSDFQVEMLHKVQDYLRQIKYLIFPMKN